MTDRLCDLLCRVTSSGRFLPEVDGLRCIAVMAVLLFHIAEVTGDAGVYHMPHLIGERPASSVDGPIAWAMGTGWMGVRLFFAISGFILALPFAEQHLAHGRRIRLGPYLTRRLSRLEPPFVICLLLLFGLQLLRFGPEWWDQMPHLLASLTYTHTLIYNLFSPINVVIWSLEVEVQFYLLMPLLAMVYRIGNPAARRVLLGLGILVLSAASVWLAPRLPLGVQNLVVFHLPYFLVGLLVADLHVTRWVDSDRSHALVMDGLALLAIPAIFAATIDPRLLLLAPWFVGLAFASVLRGRYVRGLLSIRWIVVIGGMCYTIYLYHFTVIKGLSRVTLGVTDGWALWAALLFQSVVCLAVVLPAAAFLFVLFEKPFMYRDWPRRLLRLIHGKKIHASLGIRK